MARLIGVDIPGNKRIEYALRYIYGVGPTKSVWILEKAGVDRNIKANDLHLTRSPRSPKSFRMIFLLKVISAAALQLTSVVCSRSILIVASAIAAIFPAAVSVPRPTLVPVRARR